VSEPASVPGPSVTAVHYQTVCGLALSGVILVQLQQSTLVPAIALIVNVLIGLIGALGVFYRVRLSPLYVLAAIAAPHVIESFMYGSQPFNANLRGVRSLNLADVLLCMASLTYFIGQYRLQGLRFGLVPKGDALPVRSHRSLNPAELIALIFVVPSFALLAEIGYLTLMRPWGVLDVDPRLRQLLLVVWALLLAVFLSAHAFRYWRRLRMDRVTALVLLQDVLWNETRGEQRRINRWLAWMKLRKRKAVVEGPKPAVREVGR
jgi:hypothetical protein